VLLAIPALDWVIEQYTWRVAFMVLGFAGGAWVILWALLGDEGPITGLSAAPSASSATHVAYSRLIFNPTTLSVYLAGFGAFWGQSLLIAWFTPYLMQGLGFSQYQAAWISVLPWAVGPVVSVGAGWLSQRWVAHGASTDTARGVFSGACVAIGGLALIALPFVPGSGFKIAMIVVGFVLPAVTYVMGHAMVSEYTPVSQRGGMMGIGNAFATSAGIVAPLLMGSFIQGAATPADGYAHGYLIAGLVCCFGGVIGALFSRPQTEGARLAGGCIGELVPAG
jgi:MFS family permease